MVTERPRVKVKVTSWPTSDLRWPEHCAECGKAFHPDDPRDVVHETLFVVYGSDTQMTVSEAPPGAMWNATWHNTKYPAGPDGIRLVVRLPEGVDWWVDRMPTETEIDSGMTGQTIWTRSGDAKSFNPTVSATPAVVTSDGKGWHGYLTRGKLHTRRTPDKATVLEDDDDALFEDEDEQ